MIQKKLWRKPASVSDSELLLHWRNDPIVRRNSFHSNLITPEEHNIWLKQCLASDDVELYLYFLDEEPLGQARLNYEKNIVVISYSIAEQYRGFGFGREIIRDIELLVRKTHPETQYLMGLIKKENVASQKIFEDNLFETVSETDGYYTYRKSLLHRPIVACHTVKMGINGGV